MKRLIVKLYRIVYQITGARMFSFVFAMSYITVLNMITVYGLGLLTEDLFPTSMVLRLFTFPYIFVTSLGMLTLTFLSGPSFNYITVERKHKSNNMVPVILYSAVSLLLFAYSQIYDKI